jgi:peroxiredoxin
MNALMRMCAAGAAMFAVATGAFAAQPGDVISDFRLLDQNGKAHQLYAHRDSKAVVLMIQGNGCPIVRHVLPALREIREEYAKRGVQFLLINSNLQDNRENVAREAEEFKIDFPILLDSKQTVGEALHVVRTSEIFVVDPKTWKLAYRGPVDDRVSYEKQRPAATKTYLKDALDAMLAGEPIKVARADGVGCLVNFPERGKKKARSAS